ncbi:hypothetical protein PIB30_046958 [Stylosanthes scabra]|uniref:RRM domain-containing protein n=1 Tax=Stylosanthes scabra TaxID=79078 RepID=A0ABU6SHJ5_9FABA|nr:hypothetical protein [Stylosanthes scabra]
MGFEYWNVWRRQRDTRDCEEFMRLEAISFSVFVDNLPNDVSKKELFYWFKWSGWINDIYLHRKEKKGKNYCFAFVRYTTKGGALKAIRDMNKMILRGHKIGVKETYCRREVMATTIPKNNCREVGTTCPRNTGVRIVKKVREMENDLANELVMMIREEDRGSESRVLVSHNILDEWCFPSYKENPSIVATEKKLQEVLSDASSDYQYIIVRENEAFDDRDDLLQLQDIEKLSSRGSSMKKGSMSEHVQYDREIFATSNSVRPSDLEETINQIWKVHCQGGKNKKGGRQKVTKEDEKLGIEVVNDNDDALEKVQAKDDAPKGVQVNEIEKMKSRDAYVSNVVFETGDYEDGEDLMAILKEQNEAIALKRRKTKQKEKARKSRPKRTK